MRRPLKVCRGSLGQKFLTEAKRSFTVIFIRLGDGYGE